MIGKKNEFWLGMAKMSTFINGKKKTKHRTYISVIILLASDAQQKSKHFWLLAGMNLFIFTYRLRHREMNAIFI